MEVLSPSPPLLSNPDLLPFLPSYSSSMALSSALGRRAPGPDLGSQGPRSDSSGRGAAASPVHVAIGKSLEKARDLILWSIRRFGCREVVLVHVHKPSSMIPTILGKMPARDAREEMVSRHRKEERRQLRNYMEACLVLCCEAKVKANLLLVENLDISVGLLHLISRHTIQRLVMGTSLDNYIKVMKSFRMGPVTAKNAPPFCEIWFVKKGKHIWTRDATEDSGNVEMASSRIAITMQSSPHAFREIDTRLSFNPGTNNAVSSPASCCNEEDDKVCDDSNQRESLANTVGDERPTDVPDLASGILSSVTITDFSPTVATNDETSLETNQKVADKSYTPEVSPVKGRPENHSQYGEILEESMDHDELKRKTTEAVSREKSFRAAFRYERKIKNELKKILKSIKRQQKELKRDKDEAVTELAKVTETIASLDGVVQKGVQLQDEVEKEWRLTQHSIVSLKIERYTLCRQEDERSPLTADYENHDEHVGCSDTDFVELSLLDLQQSTYDFSGSFEIGHGNNGCVYKGEWQDRSVAIKKLYPQTMQAMLEFEQEAHILGKLRHPHLVSLIGICPEACSLVSEYMPNGNLRDRLSQRSHSTSCWTWQERTVTTSEIASAILFLHLSEPDEIIHGDLKPENILFDADFRCKIGDFGIGRLVLEDSMHCPSFRKNSECSGPFSYTAPEFQNSGKLTPKSDIYSFGMIVLQILTGKPPAGLVGEVRRAMLAGRLSSVLDASAGKWPLSVATRLAEFGLQCCENNPRDRPELTNAVVRELQRLHIMEEQPVPHYFMCPILQELMHDPHMAADGYTYEGKALRNWIESGHDTSPMTNLKLENLHLTPNHTLRIAIQEWLSQSSPSINQASTD